MCINAKTILRKQYRHISEQIDDLKAKRDDIELQIRDIDKYDRILAEIYEYVEYVRPKGVKQPLHQFLNLKTDLKLSPSEHEHLIALVHRDYALRLEKIQWLRHPSQVDITIHELVSTVASQFRW